MAPSTTNYAEIQNDEIEVLRSIYMDDFVEEKPKTGAWNVGFENFATLFSDVSTTLQRLCRFQWSLFQNLRLV